MANQQIDERRKVQTRVCPVCNTVHDLPLCPTRSEERSAPALRKMDGDVLVNASKGDEQHLFAAQSIDGAIALARVMRADGWEVRIRSWDHGHYNVVHA